MSAVVNKLSLKGFLKAVSIIKHHWFDDMPESNYVNYCLSTRYLLESLLHTNQHLELREDGKVLGFILLTISSQRSLHPIFSILLTFLNALIKLTFSKAQKEHLNIDVEYDNAYQNIVKESKVDVFDGEIVLFMLEKKCIGKGYGTLLLEHAETEFSKHQCKKIFLFSDSSSNYQFYPKHGFDQKLCKYEELLSKLCSRDVKTFIFVKELK